MTDTFNDLMLRFASEQEATEQLAAAGLLVEFKTQESAGYAPAPGTSIDTIGVIYKPTGNTVTTSMGEQPEMAPLPGWHVNVRLKADHLVPGLDPYRVAPVHPVRVWA
jgi:hypothetical protein